MGKILLFILSLILILNFQPVGFVMASNSILGSVDCLGKGEVSVDGKMWTQIDRSSIVNPGKFKTSKGVLSFHFKDNVRIDLDNKTEISINGTAKDYSIALKEGKMLFSVPPTRSYSQVSTPDTLVEINNKNEQLSESLDAENNIVGRIIYDGKKTYVEALSGDVNVITLNNKAPRSLIGSNSVTNISSEDTSENVASMIAFSENTSSRKDTRMTTTKRYYLSSQESC